MILQDLNNWAKLLLVAKFTYNKYKKASTDHTLFKLKYKYHPRILFEYESNPHLKSCFTNKQAKELRELIEIY